MLSFLLEAGIMVCLLNKFLAVFRQRKKKSNRII